MRAFPTKGGLYHWINSRENSFIEKHFAESQMIDKSKLNEREQYIAQTLVSRGVLDKTINTDTTFYKLNINNMTR